MSETGIPLLDRLDAVMAERDGAVEKYDLIILGRYMRDNYYPLRDLILLYRDERDRALQDRDYESEERRTSVALLDEAYRQNDALVEALKNIIEGANDALAEDEPKYMQGALRAIYGTARAALEEARGNDQAE